MLGLNAVKFEDVCFVLVIAHSCVVDDCAMGVFSVSGVDKIVDKKLTVVEDWLTAFGEDIEEFKELENDIIGV